MEENKKSSEKIVGAVADWVETYRNLMGVRIVERTSMGASVSLLSALTVLVIVFILLFSGIGAAWWIGEQLGQYESGIFYCGRGLWHRIDHHFGNGKKGFDPWDPKPDY